MNGRNAVISGAFGRLFGTPAAKVLDVLILHRGYSVSRRELARYSGVSLESVNKVLPRLTRLGLVTAPQKGLDSVTLNLATEPVVSRLVACEFGLAEKEAEASD